MYYETISASVQKIITFRLDFGIAGEYSYTGCENHNAGCENQFSYSSRQYQVHRYTKTSFKCSLKKHYFPTFSSDCYDFTVFFYITSCNFFILLFCEAIMLETKTQSVIHFNVTILHHELKQANICHGRQVLGAG